MTRIVGLLGGECTGKSTLARALAGQLPGTVVPEALRAWVDENGRTPQACEQSGLLAAQQAAEAAARASQPAWLICDPAAVMVAVYSVIYFDDDSLLSDAIVYADQTYDVLLWCDRDLPWVADAGQRDGAQWRDRAHETLEALVPRLRVPVVRVCGPLPLRVDTAMTYLAREFGG